MSAYRRAIQMFAYQHFAPLAITTGAVMVNVAIAFALGNPFGWWGLLFWIGLGVLYAGIKVDCRSDD